MEKQKHIIVVGAGASGLMAARILAENGFQVTVVEARDRVGGRIHTVKGKFPMPTDIGAEFIHGKQPVTLGLVSEADCRKVLLEGNRYQLWNGALEKGDFFDSDWKELTRALSKLKEDTDIADFLNREFSEEKYRELRRKVQGFVEGYDAADMDRVSALALREEWEGTDDDEQYHIENGYSQLTEFLAEKIRGAGGSIVMSSEVTEIRWSEQNASVITHKGDHFDGDKVIITLPLGVLQKGSLSFSPSLPSHGAAIRQMGFGSVIKFFFEFRRSFWEDSPSRSLEKMSFVFSDADIPTWWSQRPVKIPLLTGWLGGPSVVETGGEPGKLFEIAVGSLQYIFQRSRAEIEREITAWEYCDWARDPFACGAYSYPTVQTREAVAFLSKPPGNTIYFAGEHMYNGSAMGTVEAALHNGKQVAESIIR